MEESFFGQSGVGGPTYDRGWEGVLTLGGFLLRVQKLLSICSAESAPSSAGPRVAICAPSGAFLKMGGLWDENWKIRYPKFYPSILEDVHISIYELNGEYVTEIDTFVDEVALPVPKRETGAIKVRLVIDDQRSDRVAELSNLIAG